MTINISKIDRKIINGLPNDHEKGFLSLIVESAKARAGIQLTNATLNDASSISITLPDSYTKPQVKELFELFIEMELINTNEKKSIKYISSAMEVLENHKANDFISDDKKVVFGRKRESEGYRKYNLSITGLDLSKEAYEQIKPPVKKPEVKDIPPPLPEPVDDVKDKLAALNPALLCKEYVRTSFGKNSISIFEIEKVKHLTDTIDISLNLNTDSKTNLKKMGDWLDKELRPLASGILTKQSTSSGFKIFGLIKIDKLIEKIAKDPAYAEEMINTVSAIKDIPAPTKPVAPKPAAPTIAPIPPKADREPNNDELVEAYIKLSLKKSMLFQDSLNFEKNADGTTTFNLLIQVTKEIRKRQNNRKKDIEEWFTIVNKPFLSSQITEESIAARKNEKKIYDTEKRKIIKLSCDSDAFINDLKKNNQNVFADIKSTAKNILVGRQQAKENSVNKLPMLGTYTDRILQIAPEAPLSSQELLEAYLLLGFEKHDIIIEEPYNIKVRILGKYAAFKQSINPDPEKDDVTKLTNWFNNVIKKIDGFATMKDLTRDSVQRKLFTMNAKYEPFLEKLKTEDPELYKEIEEFAMGRRMEVQKGIKR